MDDTISRLAVIQIIEKMRARIGHNLERSVGRAMIEILDEVGEDVEKLPSAESESFEWCDTCKEYDQEAHCCHRWSKMIRKTVEEMQVVRCKDCKYAEYIDDVQTLWCTECGQGKTVAPYDFCSYGERREVTA